MKLHTPYKHKSRHKNSVETLSLKWDDSNSKTIKGDIGEHLVNEFESRCYYCKQEISLGTSFTEIEHILPKNEYPQFILHPMNLTLTCTVCNTFKGDKSVSNKSFSTNPYSNYPSSSTDFNIVHAYLDIYSEHLTYENELFIKPYTQKGLETILMCNLYRLQILEDKIKKSHSDNFSIVSDLSLSQGNNKQYQDKLNYLSDHLDEILNDLKKTSVFIKYPNMQTLLKGLKDGINQQHFTILNKKICSFFEFYYTDIIFFFNLLEKTINRIHLRTSMRTYFSLIGSQQQSILNFLTERSLMEIFIEHLNDRRIENLFNTSNSKRQFVEDIKTLLSKKDFIENISKFFNDFSHTDRLASIDFITEVKKIDFSNDFWFKLYDLNYSNLKDFNNSLTLFEFYEGYRINMYFNKLKELEFLRFWLNNSGKIFCRITKSKLNELRSCIELLSSKECTEKF